MKLPWAEIPVPDQRSSYSYVLADIDHPYEFFWAKDRGGSLALRFKGRFSLEDVASAPQMAGITCSGERLDGYTYLNLVLMAPENAEIFFALCRSLMSATGILSPDNDGAALDVVLTRLRRWQDVLKAGKPKALSVERQIGLFGELLVLRDVFLANLEPYQAVTSWNGPMGDEQDFGYGKSLVEVKTARSTRDREFSVASLAQLDTASGEITLVFQTLGVFEDAPPMGLCLNVLVEGLRERLTGHAAALSEMDTRLTLSGYAEDPEYDRHHFVPASRRMFAVEGEFPRIEVRDVRGGVQRASYVVQLQDCMPFELEADTAIARIFRGLKGAVLAEVQVPPEELVQMEESSELEFKSSVRWSYKAEKPDPVLEQVIVKSVAALANTRGGTLVIGVSDDHVVLGLEKDYSTMKIPNRDGFEQHLYHLLNQAFGTVFCTQSVRLQFGSVEGKEICLVRVKRTDPIVSVEKVDKNGVRSKVYYVRLGNASRELGVDEVIAYHEKRRSQHR